MTQLFTIHPMNKRGFTLLLAALISSVVLSVGSAIYVIAHKQVLLSSLSRDSQFAFYAADTAAECALYWDSRYDYFASTTPVLATTPVCDGNTILIVGSQSVQPYSYPYTISFQLQANNKCTYVSVEKCDGLIAADGSCPIHDGTLRTIVHADGLSVSCAATSTNITTLQRSVELNY